jgi:hypothetical protein
MSRFFHRQNRNTATTTANTDSTQKATTTSTPATTIMTSTQQQVPVRRIDNITINDIISRIQSIHVNLIAIDFDQTLIDIHTGGVYSGTVHDIIPHVRPIFIKFIQAALQCGTIHIAIVTYSKQPQLIRTILEQIFGIEMASQIVIRANDKSWKYDGSGTKDGKQSHIASAVEEILHTYNTNNNIHQEISTKGQVSSTDTDIHDSLNITKRTTILIDDDQRNIRVALEDGTRAIWYNPNISEQQLYINLMNIV